MELLLDRDSRYEDVDWQGDSPLSCAALSMMDDCAKILWQRGASIHSGSPIKTGKLLVQYLPNEVKSWLDAAFKQDDNYRMKLDIDFGYLITNEYAYH